MTLNPIHLIRKYVLSTLCGSMILCASGCDAGVSVFGQNFAFLGGSCINVDDSEAMIHDVLAQINAARVERGMFAVVLDDELSEFSAEWACTMIEEGFFAHDDPTTGESFEDRWITSQFKCHHGGEILAVAYETPEDVYAQWMDSEQHRIQILENNFRRMGMSVKSNGQDLFWVVHFMDGPCDDHARQLAPSEPITGGLAPVPPLPTAREITPQAGDPDDSERE